MYFTGCHKATLCLGHADMQLAHTSACNSPGNLVRDTVTVCRYAWLASSAAVRTGQREDPSQQCCASTGLVAGCAGLAEPTMDTAHPKNHTFRAFRVQGVVHPPAAAQLACMNRMLCALHFCPLHAYASWSHVQAT